MCELTYEMYVDLGGTCPEQMFRRMKADAEADLALLETVYDVVWNTDEAKALAMVSLIDMAQSSLSAIQSGGDVTSIKVGSYSETRASGSSGALGFVGRTSGLVSRYAQLYRKPVGSIR